MKRERKKKGSAKALGKGRRELSEALMDGLRGVFGGLEEARAGANVRFAMGEIAMTAYSVFHMQSASFLEAQRRLRSLFGGDNARRFFRIGRIPGDEQVRKVLDRVPTGELLAAYDAVHAEMEGRGLLEGFGFLGGMRLVALDGTWYFCSEKIGCGNCTTRMRSDGTLEHYHSAVTPALVSPDVRGLAVPLRPEFIVPQDGSEKQDCEINAAKRFLEKNGERYNRRGKGGAVLLGDDLYSRAPFIRQAMLHGFHFIFTCLEESHGHLYKWLAPLDAAAGLAKLARRRTPSPGRREKWELRYANGVPLNGEEGAPKVNWISARVTNERGKVYACAWVTDIEITEANALDVARAGRSRWKIENEHNNTLKRRGYHLEHNFGHGSANLSCNMAALNILSFLVHTAMHLGDETYRRLREVLATRRKFFLSVSVLSEFQVWESWPALLAFMLDAKLNGPKPHPSIG